jgi:dTDP-glucose 4,6-dehydratase
MKKLLITGSMGFILNNFLRYCFDNNIQYDIVSVDKLVEPCNFNNIIKDHPLHIGDIADQHFMDMVFKKEKPDIVIHGAAESFVDNSIRHALPFVHSNVLGTQIMVDMALKYGIEKFLYTGTDEIYGQHKTRTATAWTEEQPPSPRNPYSASKMAGELIVRAAHETHGLPYLITRSSNNYGQRQNPRNLVPKIITSMLAGQPIPIHGSGQQCREWIYVEDNITAILKILESSPLNETYNIGSGDERMNNEMVAEIENIMHLPFDTKTVPDRPGHDYRYAVDCSKIEMLGWKKQYTFDQGLKKCVDWYVENKHMYLGING